MRKILYSPGFGAGWSTWNYNEDVAEYMRTYQPIIDFIEDGGSFVRWKPEHALLKKLAAECKEKFGEDHVCVLGADDLCIKEVPGRYRIAEYDGSESIVLEEDQGWH